MRARAHAPSFPDPCAPRPCALGPHDPRLGSAPGFQWDFASRPSLGTAWVPLIRPPSAWLVSLSLAKSHCGWCVWPAGNAASDCSQHPHLLARRAGGLQVGPSSPACLPAATQRPFPHRVFLSMCAWIPSGSRQQGPQQRRCTHCPLESAPRICQGCGPVT